MAVDMALIERLLDQEEGPALDFKREQYPFEGAADDQKGELLKDILAFANSRRDTTAYILLGVDELKGGRSRVVGVGDHPDDASLHQFVNYKTNRPVELSYSPFPIEGKDIGVLSIPIQYRPIYIEGKYGKVDADTVYIRDGSSTRPATPEEIAAMGRGNPPKLEVGWGLPLDRVNLPPDYIHRPTQLDLPEEFQSYNEAGSGSYDFQGLADRLEVVDVDPGHFGARVSVTPERAFLKPLGLHFYNNSGAVGENVRFTGILEEVEGSKTSGDERSGDMSMGIPEDSLPDDRLIRSNLARDAWEITVDVGHIRPGEEVWAGREFRFGAKWSGTLRLKSKFVADNLPEPINCEVPLKVEFVQRLIQRDDLNQDDGFLRMLKKARAL